MSSGYIMRELPESERPFEKCEKYGTQVLSDAELLAVILRTGTRDQNALELALAILLRCEDGSIAGLDGLSVEALKSIKGVGRVKALQLKCLTEFSKRLWRAKRGPKVVFKCPEDIAGWYMESMRRLDHEEVYLLMLDSKSALIEEKLLSVGTVNQSLVSTRDIFQNALERKASYVALVHNHPSGSACPSENDRLIAKKIMQAGLIMDVELVDSIIIGDGEFVSMVREGLI